MQIKKKRQIFVQLWSRSKHPCFSLVCTVVTRLNTGSVQRRAQRDRTKRDQEQISRFLAASQAATAEWSLTLSCELVMLWRQLLICCHFVSFPTLCQTLDGKFGEGESEAHGKFSAKEGVRPNQARPQTNMQVRVEFWIFYFRLKIHFSMSQPHGRAEGESETRDRQNSLLGNFQNEKRLAQV